MVTQPHSKRIRIARNTFVTLLMFACTIVIVKYNLSTFQLQLSPSIPTTQLRGSDKGVDDKITVDIQIGSREYFTLQHVKSEIVKSVAEANRKLQSALMNIASSASLNKSRAIMIYLPPNLPNFEREVKAMYLSIAVMRSTQPVHIKTDFVIFTSPDNFNFPLSLGCLKSLRTSFQDNESCIVLPHVSLTKRPNAHLDPLSDYSNYVDSMLILAEFPQIDAYDYLMRSDSDTFLTPGFADWLLPEGVAVATGKGVYGSTNSNNHLKWIIKTPLKLIDGDIQNIGSTWYGHSAVMVSAANLTLAAMRWLDTQEFSIYEKKFSGVDGWPNWHWPVISLYGGHIAINQIPRSKLQTHQEGVMELDYSSAHKEVLPKSAKHIHCWHTDDFFSKFKFQNGVYKEMDLTEYAEMKTTAAYSGVIAVSSDRMNVTELKNLVLDKRAMERGDWKRLLPNAGR